MNNDLFKALNALTSGSDTSHETIVREKYLRAPFGYPGGKFKSLPYIVPKLPHSKVYVEPFGGSGAVLLARQPSPLEVFNDRHSGVTCFYRCIRDPENLKKLIDRLEMTLHSREEFIWCKETWKNCQDDVERAARWWYMVTCSFSNKGMAFGRAVNTASQFGSKLKNNLQWFYPTHKRLKLVQIENQDAFQMMRDFDSPNTVFYLDPPYYKVEKLYEHGFRESDHVRLLETIFQLEGFVALSGYDNDLYSQYDWDQVHHWEVNNSMIAMAETETNKQIGTNKKRERVLECLWIKEW